MKRSCRAGWRLGFVLATGVVTTSCNRQPPPAVIVVMHGATVATAQIAQSQIAEASRDGESVIRVQQESSSDLAASSPTRAEWAVAQPGRVVVVGHESSGSSLAAMPTYREVGLPFLVPSATTPLLAGLSGVFPLPPNDSVQGAFLADFAYSELGAQTVSLFFANDEYGRGLREGVVRALDQLGVEVLEESPVLPTSNVELMVEASLTRHVPDAIIAAVRDPNIWTIVTQVQQLSPGVPVVAGDGAYIQNIIPESVGPGAESLFVSIFWHFQAADSTAQSFISEFRRLAGFDPRPNDALVFDAIMLAAAAIRQAGPDPAAVERYLEELGVTRPPYRGITGEIQFQEVHTGPLIMVSPQNGAFVPVHHGP